MKIEVKKGKAIVQNYNGFTTLIAVYVGENDDFINQQFKMLVRTNIGAVDFEIVEVDVIEHD